MDEVPLSLVDDPGAETYSRRFTEEEWDLYTKPIEESEGFDTILVDRHVREFGLHELILEEEQPCLYAESKEDSQGALDQHNHECGTKFKVVKVLMANAHMAEGEGVDFYITFQAMDEDIVQNFQAIIKHFFGKTVLSLRLEPKKSQLLQESDKEANDKEANDKEAGDDSISPNKSKYTSRLLNKSRYLSSRSLPALMFSLP